MKLIEIVVVMFGLIAICWSYQQQCNIICDHDHIPSPAPTTNAIRGKAGPKGDRGTPGLKGEKGESAESCDCSSMGDVQQQMIAMKRELEQLIGKPADCLAIKHAFPLSLSGVYRIFPAFEAINGLQVYCDMETDGGGWIVFQSRQDGSVDFFRNWDDYVQGFGELTGEFWLGLEVVHQLTSNGEFNLRVDLTDFEENSAYAQYSSFSIGEGTDYTLDFGIYSGTAGRGFKKQNFSTKDRDQDSNGGSCAMQYNGAWWYHSCHWSNLNGLYLGGETDRYATGVVWGNWKGLYYSLKTTQMKFRRA